MPAVLPGRRRLPPYKPAPVSFQRRRRIAKRESAQATTGDVFPTASLQIAYGAGPSSDLTTVGYAVYPSEFLFPSDDLYPAEETGAVTWTDESSTFRSGSMTRGRSGSFDEITTSSMTVLCRNEDRRFDPDFNGDIVPLLPIRLTWTFNGTPYVLWTGYTASNPQHYYPPLYAECTIPCFDAFEVLQAAKTLGSPHETQAALLAPDHWWRLSDTTATALDVTGKKHGTYRGTYTQEADSLVATDNDRAASTAGAGRVDLPPDVMPTGTVYTIAGWFNSDVVYDGATPKAVYLLAFYAPGGEISLAIPKVNGLLNFLVNTPLAIAGAASASRVDDNVTRHFVITREDTALTLYLDGVSAGTATLSANDVPGSGLGGALFDVPTSTTTTLGLTGTLDEVMLWDGVALTAGQALDLYNAGATGWEGDSTGQRINRYLNAAGWPAAMRDIDAGRSLMAGATNAANAMDGIRTAVKAEGGLLDITPLGKVRFRDRYRRLTDGNSTAPVATFGDGGGTEIPYFHQGFEPTSNRDRIRTQATGNRTGGPTITITDTGNRAGVRTEALGELALRTDVEVRGRLEHLLNLYKAPQYRVDAMTIRPRTQPDGGSWATAMLWSIVLGLDLGQQFTVLRRPQNVGDPTTWTVLVEQITHEFAPLDWTTTLALSPADTRRYFRLDVSDLDGADGLAF